ncbi:MAG: hypothetical protein CL908_19170 [Deltaproteobacteria bacterium]|nr:hypothetical protein [Deltaproteobacteria bacterium]
MPRGSLSRFEAGHGSREAAAAESQPEDGAASGARVRVDDGGLHRPFMRGILVHSLTEQGLSFEDAYAVAQEVWRQVRDRQLVTKQQLRDLVASLAASAPGGDFERLDPTPGDRLDVLGKDGRWPFSKGRLQMSLLAAGLDPRQGFDAVFEIESELRARGDRRVARDVIRQLANEILSRRFGEEYARRYLAWRYFQNEDDRPLILLLGGTSGVGKSSLALEVARRLSIARVLSTDSIRDVMRVMVSDDLVPTLHVSSFEAHSRLPTEVREGHDPVVEGFLEQSRTISIGVRAAIDRSIIEGTNTAIDGVSLVPGAFGVTGWQDRAHVVFLLAADEDRESLHAHLVARAHGRGARASERYVRNFQEIFSIQVHLLERAETFGIPVVDAQDLEVAAQEVVAHVVDRIAERHAAEGAAPVD